MEQSSSQQSQARINTSKLTLTYKQEEYEVYQLKVELLGRRNIEFERRAISASAKLLSLELLHVV